MSHMIVYGTCAAGAVQARFRETLAGKTQTFENFLLYISHMLVYGICTAGVVRGRTSLCPFRGFEIGQDENFPRTANDVYIQICSNM